MGWLRFTGAFLFTALVIGACSIGAGDRPPGDRPSASGSSSASAGRSAPSLDASGKSSPAPVDGSTAEDGGTPSAAAAPPPPPPRRACYRLSPRKLAEPTNDAEPVSCRGRHTARTIFVGQLDTVVAGHLVAVDSDRVRRQIARRCPRELASFVGGGRSERRLSRFEVVWFSPTLEQSDAGANWFRCDLVAFAGGGRLARLPANRRLAGILDRPRGLEEFGLCATARPGSPGFGRVVCSRRHSWRAISTIDISGGRRYPGVRAVRAAGLDECRDRVNQATDELEFSYGWEWPTRAQWERGQRYGYCWAED